MILVGPYPPPAGGVSTHIARLAEAIRARGLAVAVVNHYRTPVPHPLVIADLDRNPVRYWRVLRRLDAPVIHYHHSRWYTLVAAALALRRSPAATMITVHGGELEAFLRRRIPGIVPLTRWALESFDELVAVSVEIQRSLEAVVRRPVAVIPAYLPATDEPRALSERAEAFVVGGVTLVMSGSRPSIDGHGRTIYGLETAIEAFALLGERHRELRLAIFLASPPRSRREARLVEMIVARAGAEDVRRRIGMFYGEPLTAALRWAAVYLRPTVTDGDAVSVREALACGVPVLASDVVLRPAGVHTLALDPAVWAGAIESILQRGNRTPPTPAAGGSPGDDDRLARLIAIYDGLRPGAPAPAAVGVG